MAETLFITPAEIAATTILGGNVDPDRYVVNIAMAQISVLEPLLGTELYDKIVTDFESDPTGLTGLTGKYLTMFVDYIQPITKHEGLAEYLEVGNFLVENGGIFKHTADNRETTDKDDTQFLAGKYHAMAQMYVQRFDKWICKNISDIPEYKRSQDEVNAQNIKVTSGWYFGRNTGGTPDLDDYINNDIINGQ